MPYAGQTWTDGVTPLDATHMTALDAGVVGAVDVDNVAAAASQLVANKLLAGDAQPAFKILGDGTHSWGPGGATAPDANLYRGGAGFLQSDGAVVTGGTTSKRIELSVDRLGGGQAALNFGGPTPDTNLYRAAAATLKTDGEVFATAGLRSSAWVMANNGSVANQVFIAADGKIYFGSAADTNLYRSVANTLKTDGTIEMGALRVAPGANQVQIGSDGLMWFSNAFDVNLYRAAASTLQTDSSFVTKNGYLFLQNDAAHIYMGATNDTNLYRAAAAVLKTDVSLRVAQYLDVDNSGGGAQIRFGSAYDTNLYRKAANQLATDDQFHMPSDLGIFMDASSQPSVWWSGYALGAFVLAGSTASAAQSLRVDVGGTTYKIPLFL